MANSSQAKKRARQNNTRRLHNNSLRSQLRTSRKRFQAAVASGDIELATSTFKHCIAILDKYSGSGIVHKNTAARYKSRQATALKAMTPKEKAPEKKKTKTSKK